MNIKYSSEIDFLLKFGNPTYIKKTSLSAKKSNKLNWAYLIKQADYHQTSSYIFLNLKKNILPIPKKIKTQFKLRYIATLTKQIHLEKEFKKLASLFIKEKIEFVPLKGFALIGNLYKDPVVRNVVDIDILVKPKDLHKICKILKKNDYKNTHSNMSRKYHKKYHCHYMYIKNKELIEIHWALSFNKPNKIIIPKLWQRTIDFNIHNLKLKNLSTEDTLIALALHQRRFDKPLYLKTLLDIKILLEKHQNSIDWDYISKIAITNKLKHLFYLIFIVITNLYSTHIPKQIFNKFRPNYLKRKFISQIIPIYIFHPDNYKLTLRKKFYLMLNFIWYDTIWDIISYLLWLSQEKFAKYYNLELYSHKTKYLYKIRFLYIPLKTTINLLNNFLLR